MHYQSPISLLARTVGILSIIICSASFSYAQAGFGAQRPSSKDSFELAFGPNELALVAEETPSFPGGDGEMIKFLRKNTVRPTAELDSLGITGTVYVEFVVTKEGKPKFFRILKGLSPLANAEALRVVRLMPNWTPARTRGQPVNLIISIPISFKQRGN